MTTTPAPPTDTAAALEAAIETYAEELAAADDRAPIFGPDGIGRTALRASITAHVEAEVARRLAGAPDVEAAMGDLSDEFCISSYAFDPLLATIAADDAAAAKAKRDAETSAYLDDLTASTVLAVEATDFEAMTLWLNWTKPRDERPIPAWAEIGLGRWVEVGKLGGDPVCVTLSFARVNGAAVAFYAATSVVSDSRMVEAWVRANMPRARLTNAMNFAPPAAR